MTKIKSSTSRQSMPLHRIIYLNPTTPYPHNSKTNKRNYSHNSISTTSNKQKTNTKITIFHVKWFFSSPHHLSMTWLNHISIPQLNQQSTHNKTVYIYLLLPFFSIIHCELHVPVCLLHFISWNCKKENLIHFMVCCYFFIHFLISINLWIGMEMVWKGQIF